MIIVSCIVLVWLLISIVHGQLATDRAEDAEKRATDAEYDAAMLREQLRCTEGVVIYQGELLHRASMREDRLRRDLESLAKERPMTFRDLPLFHAAHVHLSRDDRQLWLTWDN